MKQKPFQPNLTRGAPVAAVNAVFAIEAEKWRLQFRCSACANGLADGGCLMRWPNDHLQLPTFEAVGVDGVPRFCKAFETLDG